MKKQNQAPRTKVKTSKKTAQQNPLREYEELLIPIYRQEELQTLATTIGVTPIDLAEQVFGDYLLFIEKYPDWAQAQPRFVHGTAALVSFPKGPLYDRMDDLCRIYQLDKNSVADAALRAFGKFARHNSGSGSEIKFTRGNPGLMDPENFLFIFTQPQSPAQCTFAKIATQLCNQDFEAACGDLAAFQSLIMYHPGFKEEREALEMITEGANRLWASPAQTTWRKARQQ